MQRRIFDRTLTFGVLVLPSQRKSLDSMLKRGKEPARYATWSAKHSRDHVQNLPVSSPRPLHLAALTASSLSLGQVHWPWNRGYRKARSMLARMPIRDVFAHGDHMCNAFDKLRTGMHLPDILKSYNSSEKYIR
jgi:hypothetical protein